MLWRSDLPMAFAAIVGDWLCHPPCIITSLPLNSWAVPVDRERENVSMSCSNARKHRTIEFNHVGSLP